MDANIIVFFCASRTISGKHIAFRSVEDVLDEIDFLVNKYGVRSLIVLDDCFLADCKRVMIILNEMINRNYNLVWEIANVSAWHLDDELLELMKRAGCIQITVFVESGNERVLHQIIRKPLKL